MNPQEIIDNFKSANPSYMQNTGISGGNNWLSDVRQGAYRPSGGQPEKPDKSFGFGGTKFLGENLGVLSEAKPLMQTSKTGTALQNTINQRVASGKTTPQRAQQLSQGLQPDISNVAPTHTTGEVVRGGIKSGLDIGSLAIGGGGVTGVAKATLGGLVKQGAIQGAKYGATSGAMQGLGQGIEENQGIGNTVEQTAKGGAVGGLAGGAVGGALPFIANARSITGEAKNAIISKGENMIKGKSLQEILQTPESQVSKLNPVERQTWFDNAHEQLTTKHEQINQNITKDLQTKSLASQNEAEQLKKELSMATRDKVLELRPKIVQAMGKQSATYRKLVEEDMAGKGKLIVSPSEIKTYVTNGYSDNPQQAEAIIERLGLNDAKTNTTVERIFNQSKSLKQELSAGAKGGTKTFTANDKLTDDAISNLMGYLKDAKGVDFKNANQFWSKYAPIRNQLVSEAKPFVQSGTQTKTFAGTLSRVARGTDVNNENFIGSVEKLVGQPITKEARGIITKMDTNTKTALSDKINAEAQRISNQMKKDQSLKNLSIKQFEIERQVRVRDGIKKVLKYVVPGIIGEEFIRRF